MSEEIPNEGGKPQTPQSASSASQAQSTPSTQSLSQAKSQAGSSSSSGPTSGSQSSSGSGTLSSVDTIPVTLPSVPEEPEPQPWGRLLPMATGFRAHSKYTFVKCIIKASKLMFLFIPVLMLVLTMLTLGFTPSPLCRGVALTVCLFTDYRGGVPEGCT
ncbi:hypothetical protein LDENG_00280460, partial [Lucifuga dentata]